MLQFATQGKVTNPPIEIVEFVFLQELHGYTRTALNGEPYEWVLAQFTILNALNEEAANQRKAAERKAKQTPRRR